MEKLVRGIIDFRRHVLPARREIFARLAKGQNPDALWITCSDSRIAPNWFISNNPGDLFVVRNVGNLVPPSTDDPSSDQSVAAAIEFAVLSLNVKDIVVCGHSECGAMHALSSGKHLQQPPFLRQWLRFGEASLRPYGHDLDLDRELSACNSLSQVNVLQQIEHLKTYDVVRERHAKGELRLHAWWFEIATGSLHAFDEMTRQFAVIDEESGQALLGDMQSHNA